MSVITSVSTRLKTESVFNSSYRRISIRELLNDEPPSGEVKSAGGERNSFVLGNSVLPDTLASICLQAESTSVTSRAITRKPQGRPNTQKLVGLFTIFDCKEDLILDLIRSECLQLLHGPPEPIMKSPNMFCLRKLIDLKEPQVYNQLKSQFQTKDNLQFIKLIRDHKGKLLRLETVPCTESQINIDFIKRNVCYPRYKSNMKFYLVRSDCLLKKFIYYNNRNTFEHEKHLIDMNIEVWVR